MRQKQDHLPRGVRWAVRILRLFGTVIILPVLCLMPVVLLSTLLRSGSSWMFDFVLIAIALSLALGGALRVMATCIELTHDPSCCDSDPGIEWNKFAIIYLNILAIGFALGSIGPLVVLVTTWQEKGSNICTTAICLTLHVVLVISLHRGACHLGKWFNQRRMRHGLEP